MFLQLTDNGIIYYDNLTRAELVEIRNVCPDYQAIVEYCNDMGEKLYGYK